MITDKMLEENTTSWGLLSLEMMEAFILCEVEDLEFYSGSDEWKDVSCRRWVDTLTYRKKVIPLTKPDIPWDIIQDKWAYAVKDKYGLVWLYDRKPTLRLEAYWDVAGDRDYNKICVPDLLKVDPGTCNWKDSLVCCYETSDKG